MNITFNLQASEGPVQMRLILEQLSLDLIMIQVRLMLERSSLDSIMV